MTRFKVSSLIIHLAVWLLFMSFPVIFLSQDGNRSLLNTEMTWRYTQFFLLYAFIFYLNVWYLFPRLYFAKKHISYFVSVALLVIVVLTIQPFDRLMQQIPRQQYLERRENQEQQGRPYRPFREGGQGGQIPPPVKGFQDHRPPPGPDKRYRFDLSSLILLMMVMGIGSAMRSIEEWQLTEKRAILAEADRANAELSFLKAQINPHFLYNTLNNIYTLCITGNEHAAESIMKLSNIMRYVTDEAEANFVPLHDELDCIENFIDLQKLRLGKKVTLNYQVTGDSSGHLISPLILMTFIENVFKYGLSNHTETQIEISISIEPDRIIFYAQNKIFKNKRKQERSGLGIKNTRRRLDHLYAGKHSLIIDDQNELFTVKLILNS